MKDIEPDYIYGLKHRTPEGDFVYFYVGRSTEPRKRMKAHRLETATGTEAKYQYMRQLEAAGIPWFAEILSEITTAEQDYEDYYVWKLIGEGFPLQNQRAGDRAQQLDSAEGVMRGSKTVYSSPAAFLAAREREVAEAAARAQAARLRARADAKERAARPCDPERTVFATLFEDERKFVSPGVQAMLAKRVARGGHVHGSLKR